LSDSKGCGVSSLVIEHFDVPANARNVHALGAAGERAGDVLAGRTVWCARSLPGAYRSAETLRVDMDGAGPDGAAAPLRVAADEQLLGLAERVEGMLTGGGAGRPDLGRAERETYARAAMSGGELVGERVEADDVVVVHDALSAIVARAVRERGAHTVWRIRAAGAARPSARQAFEFVKRYTPGVDAYVLTWLDRGARGEVVQSVGAAMPTAGLLATKEFPTRFAGDEPRRLAWRMALAEIVRSDRGERVGGTLHPCPTVAPH
jgi:Trehalose synthase, N-terminal domain